MVHGAGRRRGAFSTAHGFVFGASHWNRCVDFRALLVGLNIERPLHQAQPPAHAGNTHSKSSLRLVRSVALDSFSFVFYRNTKRIVFQPNANIRLRTSGVPQDICKTFLNNSESAVSSSTFRRGIFERTSICTFNPLRFENPSIYHLSAGTNPI